jgi:hypothetical protein
LSAEHFRILRTVIIGLLIAVGLARLLFQRWPLLLWDRGKLFQLPKLARARPVQLSDLPQIVNAMTNGTAKVRYAGLTFNTPDRPKDDDAVNLNLSFENGKVGFDWVLLATRNLQDEAAFKEFARRRGIEPVSLTMNGVSYLRVECGDIAKFTASIAMEMYACPQNQTLTLFHDGFTWPN